VPFAIQSLLKIMFCEGNRVKIENNIDRCEEFEYLLKKQSDKKHVHSCGKVEKFGHQN
jgi:hypothetical protein